MRMEIKKDREEIAKIIINNIRLLNKNSNTAYGIADCILLYYIEKKSKERKNVNRKKD